jgi:CRP-like cAMP-binding protein
MLPPPELLAIDAAAAAHLSAALKLEGFFPEFTVEHATKLFPRSGLYFYPQDGAIVEQGETGKDLFVVCSGQLQVERRDGGVVNVVATMKAGDIIGEIALLKNCPRTATVTALGDSRVFRLAFADLDYILKHNKELGAHLRELAKRRMG